MKHALIIAILIFQSVLFAKNQKTLIIIGDSLTEGYGLSKDRAYPRLMEKEWGEWIIINAGISGTTSATAPARVTEALKSYPDAILLALGANDGLRRLSPDDMKKNLGKAIDLAQESYVPVLLAGMKAPPEFGLSYTEKFEAVFEDLAKEEKIPLLPFLLEGIARVPSLNLEDGMHPNEEGQRRLAKLVLSFLKRNLK